jgi:hypothetical protein
MSTIRFQIEYKGSVLGVTMNKHLIKGYSGYPFKAEDAAAVIEFIKDNFRKNYGVPFTILIDRDGVKESIEVLT